MIELSWSAPESCPTVQVVEQRVERILNRPLAGETQQLTVTAVVTPPAGAAAWSVTLESTSGQQRATRTLQAASCDELVSATAVFLAILIEPEHPEPEPEPASAPAPAARAPAQPGPPRRAPVRFALGVTASARSAGLPAWAAGGGLHGALSWRALRASVGIGAWLPVDETITGSENQGARLQLSSGSARLCWQAASAPLVPALCGGAELAALRGRGFGPGVQPESETAWFGSLLAGATLRLLSTEHLAVLVETDALAPLGDRQMTFAGAAPAEIHEPSWGLRLACGAEWSF
jgi:hypothetical protein